MTNPYLTPSELDILRDLMIATIAKEIRLMDFQQLQLCCGVQRTFALVKRARQIAADRERLAATRAAEQPQFKLRTVRQCPNCHNPLVAGSCPHCEARP